MLQFKRENVGVDVGPLYLIVEGLPAGDAEFCRLRPVAKSGRTPKWISKGMANFLAIPTLFTLASGER